MEFAQALAVGSDIYVNGAFAVSHRPHTSNVQLASLFERRAAAPSFIRELEAISRVGAGESTLVILGGSKNDKKDMLAKFAEQPNTNVRVGGKVASLVSPDDYNTDGRQVVTVAQMTADGFDISEESADGFVNEILSRKYKVIFWNAPVGWYEGGYREGSRRIAQAISEVTRNGGVFTLIGGGNTVEFVSEENKLGYPVEVSYTCVGGGATLTYLGGEELPAARALQKAA